MLDIEMLKAMPPHCHFACGNVIDNPEGINMCNTGKQLKWVAVRGGIPDWTIYILWDTYSYTEISRMGDKVFNRESIRKLVPCTDEAFKMYRF